MQHPDTPQITPDQAEAMEGIKDALLLCRETLEAAINHASRLMNSYASAGDVVGIVNAQSTRGALQLLQAQRQDAHNVCLIALINQHGRDAAAGIVASKKKGGGGR